MMSKHWERDLSNLQQHILGMAGSVEEALYLGIRALRERNLALAQRVIAGDSAIDQEENYVENECLKMLALHQPVAVDLRRVVAALKINTDLERMADLAVNIAERAAALTALPPLAVPSHIPPMADLATAMVRQSLDAFVDLDLRLARRVIRQDDEVDRFNREVIGELIEAMRASPAAVPAFLSLFSVVRHLERIADHATNIAEVVVYLGEGQIVRHQPEAERGRD
jgi:phosphate transport system protein